LGDRRELNQLLRSLEEQNQSPVTETAYLLGRLAEEEGDFQQAGFQFRRSLQSNPQFFPARVHLEKVLRRTGSSGEEGIELENVQNKIRFFEMTEVVGDAWAWEGISSGLPGWKAAYRTGKKQERIEIIFSGDTERAWKLLLDGQFVTAWAGTSYRGEKSMTIPAGEHEFKLICFTDSIRKAPEKNPFKLILKFKKYD
jgi:tetratricopeptide (TPR) repeat protein